MARWKYTLIFEGRGHGWSESYYLETATDSFPTTLQFLSTTPGKRAALLGKEVTLKAFRLGLVIDQAGNKLRRVSQPFRINLDGDQSKSADQTNTSLEALWITGDGKNKKVAMMGGIWDAVLPAPDRVDPTVPGFITAWNGWVTECQLKGLGWLTSGPSDPVAITNTVFDPTTGHTTYTLKAPGFANWPNGIDNPNKVRVEFPLSKSPLDGVQLVIPSSATEAMTAKPRPSALFTVVGKMQTFAPQLVTLASVAGGPLGTILWQVGMSRKRGRPLLESRGRRPVRDLW